MVAISEVVCTVLDDWLANCRPDATDGHGREPLVTAGNGRPSTSTVRRYAYSWTQPCRYGAPCPHDRDPQTCEATERRYLSRCPSSVSPHAFRRGSITHALNQEVPETVVSGRTNVSLEVLDKHYDRRTKTEKMEQRRQYLDNL